MKTIEHVSFSSLSMFDRCGVQWFHRYVMGRKIPPSGAQIQGRAFDKAETTNFAQKIETKEDLPVEQAKEVYASDFDANIPEAKLDEGEEPGALKDQGISLVEVFHKEMAPKLHPLTVQEKAEVKIADTQIVSYTDMIDEERVIRDLKTSGKSYSENAAALSLQLTAYDFTYRVTKGDAPAGLAFNVAIKTKVPKVQEVTSPPRSVEQLKAFEEEVGLKMKAIAGGVFLPAPADSWACSEKFCGYFGQCTFGARRHYPRV